MVWCSEVMIYFEGKIDNIIGNWMWGMRERKKLEWFLGFWYEIGKIVGGWVGVYREG